MYHVIYAVVKMNIARYANALALPICVWVDMYLYVPCVWCMMMVYKQVGPMTAGGLSSTASAAQLLKRLLPLAVVQEVGGAAPADQAPGEARYTMHPFVRDFAADMLRACGREEQAGTYAAFASFMLRRAEELTRMGATASSSRATEQLISDEMANIRALALKVVETTREREAGLERLRCCETAAVLQQRSSDLEHPERRESAEFNAWEKAVGPLHKATVSSRIRMTALLKARGKLGEAEEMQRRIVNALERGPEASSPATERAHANLARIQEMRRCCASGRATGPEGTACTCQSLLLYFLRLCCGNAFANASGEERNI